MQITLPVQSPVRVADHPLGEQRAALERRQRTEMDIANMGELEHGLG